MNAEQKNSREEIAAAYPDSGEAWKYDGLWRQHDAICQRKLVCCTCNYLSSLRESALRRLRAYLGAFWSGPFEDEAANAAFFASIGVVRS